MDRLNYIKTRVRRLEHAKSRRGVANQQAKESHKRLRIEVLKHYSNGLMICDCCPENRYEFLTIDHIKGGGTKHRKIVKNMYRWLKKNNYPDGYRVLCMNCNYSYGHYGYCPHQQK